MRARNESPRALNKRLLLGWAMLAAVAMALIAPSFIGWHHDDDLQNMRWVIEYSDAPWLALTDRHALHDHIRPATLWATWLGTQISNGAWWGPHLVVAGLLLGAWIAMGTLVGRLVGSRVAGLLAAALILDLEGFRMILDWNAWINTAGEICFGLIGLCLVHSALERDAAGRVAHRALGGAALCMVLAGLFKEPGWVVYPGVAALMALVALRRGATGRAPYWVGSMLLIGVAGFVWSHTTANVERLGAVIDVLGKLKDLQHAVRPLVDTWPGGEPRTRAWTGIALPLVGLATAGAVVLRRGEHPTAAQGRWIILGTGALSIIGYIRTDLVGAMAGAAVIAMLFVHRSGILASLAVLTAGVMFLFPGPNPVQLLPAAMAFAALIAIHSARLVQPGLPPALRLFAALILTGALGLQALQIGDRLRSPFYGARDVPGQLEARDRVLGEGALFAGLGARTIFSSSELGTRILGPLFGFRVIPFDRELGPYSMQVSRTLWLAMDSAPAAHLLLSGSLLDEHRASGQPGTLDLVLGSGFYAMGMALEDPRVPASIAVRTDCGGEHAAQNDRAEASWVVATFRVQEGCTDVQVDVRTRNGGEGVRFFLSPLPDPVIDLRDADFYEPVLGLQPVIPLPQKHPD